MAILVAMAILKIARMGHPVLRRAAEPIADPAAPEVARLIDDMLETMLDANGAGLAAPQVHVPKRLVIFHIPRDDLDADLPPQLTVLINPVLAPLSDETEEDWEGCLSVPGLRGLVPRPTRVRYSGFDFDGNLIDREVDGFHARVAQHEYDHLIGRLYPTRMRDLTKFGYTEVLFPEDAGRPE
jgi:peptide deformylase